VVAVLFQPFRRCASRPLCVIRVLAALACLVTLTVMWLESVNSVQHNEQAAMERIRSQAGVRVRAAADTLQASIDRFDYALRAVRAAAADQPEMLAKHGRIVIEALPSALVLQLFHIDADGYLSYSSLGPAPRNFLGDRDYFRRLAASESDPLVVSNPVLGRLTGKWSIQFARGVRHDGVFVGVVSIAISADEWMTQLRRYEVGPHDILTLLSSDGHYLLHSLGRSSYFGKRVPEDRPFLVQPELAQGDYIAQGAMDGVTRLYSWQRLSSGLIMAAGIAIEDEMVATVATNRGILLRTSVSTLLILFATGALLYALWRYEQVVHALEVRNQHHRSVLDNIGEGIMVVDADDRIVSINPAVSVLTGYSEAELLGQRCDALSPAFEGARKLTEIIHEKGGSRWVEDFDGLRKNGNAYTGRVLLTVMQPTLPDEAAHRVVVLSDVTELRRKADEVWRQANFDALTGLANRSLMIDRLERMITHARRQAEEVVVLFVDLDRFKPVNDLHGHEVGDLVLCEVARRLETMFRDEDTVARLGGDEFVVLLTGGDTRTTPESAAARVVESLSAPYELASLRIEISCCVGIARFPVDGDSASTLIHAADMAMYRAKDAGRSTWSI